MWQRLGYRICCLAALTTCGVLLVDYFAPAPAFCHFQNACDRVIFSGYGKLAGVPLPLHELLAFGAFYLCTFSTRATSSGLLLYASLAAAGIAALLMAIQIFVLQQICYLCMIVDLSALLLALVGLIFAEGSPATESEDESAFRKLHESATSKLIWGTLAPIAISAGPIAASLRPPAPIPERVQQLWNTEAITLVEVTDFDCKYCRQQQPILNTFLSEKTSPNIQRIKIVAPVADHQHSQSAGLAYLAAIAQNQGDEMAERLHQADDLSPEACRELAHEIGLDLTQYDEVVASTAVAAELEANVAWIQDVNDFGAPQIWLENQFLPGLQTKKTLDQAFLRAQRFFQQRVDSENK